MFDWKDHSVHYDLGGVVNYVPPRDDLLAMPLQEQYTVTGIRLHRNGRQQRQFWTPVLKQVETEIGQMLDIVGRNGQDRAAKQDKLFACRERIESVYFRALNKLAQDQGGKAGPMSHAVAAETITVRTDPPKGELARIGAGEWSFYLYFKDKGQVQKPQWESLPTGQVCLYGKNWISAKWPDIPGWVKLVDIGTAKVLTIAPHGFDKR